MAIVIFDLYALGFAAVLAAIVLVCLSALNDPAVPPYGPWRPYDWAVDGECNNHSKPRLIAQYKGDRR